MLAGMNGTYICITLCYTARTLHSPATTYPSHMYRDSCRWTRLGSGSLKLRGPRCHRRGTYRVRFKLTQYFCACIVHSTHLWLTSISCTYTLPEQVHYTPKFLRIQIKELKEALTDKNLPFGVDLLLPQIGGTARKTNQDYTHGKLEELIDVIIEEKASLFVSAVGVPPKWVVDKLHTHGIVCMNMIGAPKHVDKALEVGMDMICCQGGEGGGHTGDISTTILLPAVIDKCKGKLSAFTKTPILVIGAGGIHDGKGVAMALAAGAAGVWVGTRFVACVEAGAPKDHKEAVVKADYTDTFRTLVFSGRPLRIGPNEYASMWEQERAEKMKKLLQEGKVPVQVDTCQCSNVTVFLSMYLRLYVFKFISISTVRHGECAER